MNVTRQLMAEFRKFLEAKGTSVGALSVAPRIPARAVEKIRRMVTQGPVVVTYFGKKYRVGTYATYANGRKMRTKNLMHNKADGWQEKVMQTVNETIGA